MFPKEREYKFGLAWLGKVGRYSGFVDDSAKFNLRGEGVLVCEVLVVV